MPNSPSTASAPSCSRLALRAWRRHHRVPAQPAMIIITQPNATEDQIERVVARVREFGLDAQVSRGASRVIIGVIGAEDRIREKPLAAMPGVEAIVPVEKPYKLASYEFLGAASPVSIGGVKIRGDKKVALICRPCAVESQDQISSLPHVLQELGADIL